MIGLEMRIQKRAWIFVLGSVLVGPRIYACNSLTVANANYNLATNTNPILDISVKRANRRTYCDYFIVINKGVSYSDGTYNRKLRNQTTGANFIDLAIKNAASVDIFDLPEASYTQNSIAGTFDATGTRTKVVQYGLRMGVVPPASPVGVYSNVFTAHLYSKITSGSNPDTSFVLRGSASLGAYYTISTSANVSLVDQGSPYNPTDTSQSLNFGNLSLNQTIRFDMWIASNTSYSFSLGSASGGRLMRNGTETATNQTVSYSILLGSNAWIPATTISTLPYNSPLINTGNGSPKLYPVTVRIDGDPSQKMSGTYSDAITITITAN